MIRPSSLPVARFCGLAGRLARENTEAMRSANVSKTWHAIAAGAPEARQLWDRLTDSEKKEVGSWKKPDDVQPPKGPLLKYDDATKETKIAIDGYFDPVEPGSPDVLTEGTPDFLWVVTAKDGTKVVFLGDLKRTRWSAIDGPDSLQLLAYCIMAAAKHKADAYCPGVWIAEESRWVWSDTVTMIRSKQGLEHMRLVKAAATNDTGEASTGSHCQTHCWARTHCPAYIAPAADDNALAPALTGTLNEGNARDVLFEIERQEEQLKLAKDNLKAAVSKGLKVLSEDGTKQYRAITCNGRKSFNEKMARQELGERFEAFVTKGAPYQQVRWTKA